MNCFDLRASVSRSERTAGFSSRTSAITAATCIAVGNVSLDDWPRLTSSFGCTSRASPRLPPRSSEARFASTSFTFMLLCVPEPVCQTESGNSPSCLPSSTSCAARWIASAFFASSSFSPALTCAAAFLTRARPYTTGSGMRSLEMRKKRRLRSVCAPHSRSAGTSIGPKLSFSVRVPPMAAVMLLLQQGAQHPGVFLVDIHPLREQVERGLVVGVLGNPQHAAGGAHHRFLRGDKQLHHFLRLRHAV